MNGQSILATRLNRRTVVASAAAGATAIGTGHAAIVQATTGFKSGGLGLTKNAFEEIFGPGEQVETPGHPIYDSTYSHGTQLGTVYVWYMEVNGESYASYIEVDFADRTLDANDARRRAESLMPSDATFTELYIAPATPSGPVAVEMMRFTSESLGTLNNAVFAPEIVLMIQEPWDDSNQGIPAFGFSIMTRMVTQAG